MPDSGADRDWQGQTGGEEGRGGLQGGIRGGNVNGERRRALVGNGSWGMAGKGMEGVGSARGGERGSGGMGGNGV